MAFPALAADQLPSRNDTANKRAIIDFVEQVTQEGSPRFVPEADRITTFDNDAHESGRTGPRRPQVPPWQARRVASETPKWF
jgi:hypothetical protein